jgi:hypothetical protein
MRLVHASCLVLQVHPCGRTCQGLQGGRGYSEVVYSIMAEVIVLQSGSAHHQ